MKPVAAVRLALLSSLLALACAPEAWAQRQLGRKTGPTGKLYLSEVQGASQVVTGEKIYEARQATAFDAPGTVFETEPNSHLAFVLSNGTGIYLDGGTRMQIDRLDQENFQPAGAGLETEPSISKTSITLTRGFMGISTNEMSSGSSMVYSTPHSTVNVRGRNVAIQTDDKSTVIYLLEGDVTVSTLGLNPLTRVVRPGEQATVWPGPPPSIVITGIPDGKREMLGRVLSIAADTRKTVTFDLIEKRSAAGAGGSGDTTVAGTGATGGAPGQPAPGDTAAGASFDTGSGSTEQEIVARPTVPATVPVNIVVSPDRLPGRG